MTGDDSDGRGSRQQTVRPRWVWGGLAVAVLGAALLGLGIAMLSWTVSVVGVVLILVGAAAGLRGGILFDAVSEFAVHKELSQVREGDTHGGVVPGQTVPTPEARDDAVTTDRAVGRRMARAHDPSGVRWASVAGAVLLLVTALLVASQWEMVPSTAAGRGNSVRDTSLAVLLGLGGIRLVTAPGRHLITVAVLVLAGLGVALGGLLADHDSSALAVVEVGCGCVAVLCALTALVSPVPESRDVNA